MTMDTTEAEGVTKARIVLNALRAAALRPPYAFDQDEAEPVWGAAIMQYDLAVLTRTCGIWIEHHDEFPSVAEFKTIADSYVAEERSNALAQQQADQEVCPECDGNRYATIRKMVIGEDGREVEDHYAMPCSRCLPERHELYQRGHFDAEHVDRGGCPQCWTYLPSLRERHKADVTWR